MLNVLIVLMHYSCPGFHRLWIVFQDPRGVNNNVQAKFTRKLAKKFMTRVIKGQDGTV